MKAVVPFTTDMEKAKKFGSPSQARFAGDELLKNTTIATVTVEAKMGKKIVCQLTINSVPHFIAEEEGTSDE
jgi:hypothetical protein